MTLNCDFIVVPRIVLSDENLTSTDKLLMGLITSLTLKYDYCFASNKYLADTLNTSKRTINYSLSKLKEKNLIKIKIENNTRKIYLNKERTMKNISRENENNCNTNIERNCNYNKKNNFKRKNIILYWMEHPEVCKEGKASPEEIKEMEELLKEFRTNKES